MTSIGIIIYHTNKEMNIPRELFTDLSEMVYVQNCNLIRRICSDNDWNAEAMISDLLDKSILLDDDDFETEDHGIVAQPMTESEMEKQYNRSYPAIPSTMLQSFISDELIHLQQTITIQNKKYNLYQLNNGVSGLLVRWNSLICIWDQSDSKMYSIQGGSITLIDTVSLPVEEMVKHIINF